MVEKELKQLIEKIQTRKCEENTIEVKSAHQGCPEKLYDTISAFSNQNAGGIIVFGLDEKRDFAKVGVYDAQDLQNKVMEYCEQMTPVCRPVFTSYEEEGQVFVSAEIPPIDIAERPCFKTAKGRLQGSYIRVGDADKPMTEYEIYSYEAYRKKIREDIRPIEGISFDLLDGEQIEEYLTQKKQDRPNLSKLSSQQLYELTGITSQGKITLSALLLFGVYPQSAFPQLSIIATSVPGIAMGQLDEQGRRFIDSKRIEGTLPDMLEAGLEFVRSNTRKGFRINFQTGMREDCPQYPLDAVREALLNALVHRDYSIHTENKPIQLILFYNRLEIINPGGLYGRITVDQLGNVQPDTRNPVLATAMESLGKTENRYSGIPRIRLAMKEWGLPQPVFTDHRSEFSVCLYNSTSNNADTVSVQNTLDEKGLLAFCNVPRTRSEIAAFLQITSTQYALRRYLDPLLRAGLIRLTIPEKPQSSKQQYVTVEQ